MAVPRTVRQILSILFLATLGWGCQTPTSDAAAAFRSQLTGKAWHSDPAWAATDPVQVELYFYGDGRVLTGGGRQGSWSVSGNTLVITGDYGTETTVNPDAGPTHLYLNYGGGLCHLYR